MAKSKTYDLMIKIGAKSDGTLRKACAAADKDLASLSKSAKAVGKAAAAGFAAASTAAVAFSTAAVTSAAGYKKELSNVKTLLTGTDEEIAARTASISSDILTISDKTGVVTSNLTDGMYQVVSAFGDVDDASSILETAAKSAAAGNATTTDSVNLLSAVTKGYGDISAEAVQKAADLSFATVRLGQTSFPELASSIGKVVPLASALGVQQEELYGTFATLTGVTGSTAEVATQYKSVLSGLMSPSKSMDAALSKIGYSTADAAIKSLGFQGTLEALMGTVGGDTQAMAKLFSSVEAQTAILALCGKQSSTYAEKTAEMYNATGAADEAFARQTDNLDYKIQKLTNRFQNFLTKAGLKLLPYLEKLADKAIPYLTDAMDKGLVVLDDILPKAEKAVQFAAEHKELFIALASGVLTAVTAFKTFKTAMTAISAAKNLVTVFKAASNGGATLGKAAEVMNLKLLLIVAAIGIVVTACVWMYRNWDKVTAWAQRMGTKVSEVWTSIQTAVLTTVAALVSGFQTNFPLLSAYLSGWWNSVSAAVENVKAIFSNLIQFVENVFSGNWGAAWQNIVNIFANIFGAIVNLAKAPMNGVISAINYVLGKINSLNVKIPDWVPVIGGNTFSFNIPQIPQLATGGIVTAPTLLEAGEGGEPEAIIPLSKLYDFLLNLGKPDPTKSKPQPTAGGQNPPPEDKPQPSAPSTDPVQTPQAPAVVDIQTPDPTKSKPQPTAGGQNPPPEDKPQPQPAEGGGGGFVFSPTIIFKGNGSVTRKEVDQAMDFTYQKFVRFSKQLEEERRRKSFSPA